MNNKIVLLVEDNADDEALTLRALRKNNIPNEVVVVHDGQEALDYLFGQGPYAGRELPQIVLLDLKLPKISGLEVLQRLREDPRNLFPAGGHSHLFEGRTRPHRGIAIGNHSYVQKPVDFREFTEAVRQLGLYWLILNEPPPKPGAANG